VLWQSVRKLLAAEQFATHLDRRETFASDLQPIDLSQDDEPFWFDFVSDTGDGGDATVAVAQALLAPDLAGTQARDEQGAALPQGRLLILGGDLAYPGSGRLDYQYRFIEPFEQAQAWAGAGRWAFAGGRDRLGTPLLPEDKVVVAIPQNHDWTVSASVFSRYFVNQDRGAVIKARTPQRQSWFALQLPRRWWVLGLDFALDGDIDRNQYEGFVALIGAGISAGSELLLVYPEPYWTRPLGDGAHPGYPKRYQRLEAQLLAAGARIRLRLAGDLHHYAHDSLALPDGSDTHLVVAGHGGAFTHCTHSVETQRPRRLRATLGPGADELAQHVEVGIAAQAEHEQLPAFTRQGRYPSPLRSRRLAVGAWWKVFRFRGSGAAPDLAGQLREQWDSNRGLLPVMGGLIALLTWFGWGINPQIDLSAVPSPSAVLPALAVFGVATGALYEPLAKLRSLLLGGLHGLAQLAAAWVLTLLCFQLHPWAGWPAFIVGASLSSGLLLGGALALACGVFGLASNACSGLAADEGHKGFLRFRLDDAGLTVFALGLDRVPAQPEVPAAGTPIPPAWRVVERFTIRSSD
jgi:hypothetical protein